MSADRMALEAVEREAWLDMYAAAPPPFATATGLAATRLAGAAGFAIRAAPTIEFNRLQGLGVEEPATEAALDAAIDWLRTNPTRAGRCRSCRKPCRRPGSRRATSASTSTAGQSFFGCRQCRPLRRRRSTSAPSASSAPATSALWFRRASAHRRPSPPGRGRRRPAEVALLCRL